MEKKLKQHEKLTNEWHMKYQEKTTDLAFAQKSARDTLIELLAAKKQINEVESVNLKQNFENKKLTDDLKELQDELMVSIKINLPVGHFKNPKFII